MKLKFILIFFVILSHFSYRSQSLYFPPLTGNVWDSILPANLNYCQPRIDSLYNYLQAKNTKSFILLKDGKRVLEKYFGTYTKDSLWYWASASKSLAGFITGIAQEKGFININSKVSQYLGVGWTSAPQIKEDLINVKDLLKMTSGLNDAPPLPCDNEDTAKACLTYLTDAATRWSYHTGAYRKVQDVVSTTAGLSYNTVTTNWVKTKIGMSGLWAQQIYYSRARDMARFGLLNLSKGIWAQDTVMKDSLYFKAMVNTSQTLNKAYGYLWWLNGKANFMAPASQITIPGTLMSNAPADMFCALGKNDQKIYVVPSQNIVIVRQGNTAGGFNLAASAFDNTLWDYINKLTCAVTGVGSNVSEGDFKMYPNPVNDILTIENNDFSISKVEVYDVLGNKMISIPEINKTQKTQIDLLKFNKGIYFIQIEGSNKAILRKKIIKY